MFQFREARIVCGNKGAKVRLWECGGEFRVRDAGKDVEHVAFHWMI